MKLLHDLFRLPVDKGQVIYNGRPFQYFHDRRIEVRDCLRSDLEIPNNAILCFTAARLDPGKGHQYQLEAIKYLKHNSLLWTQLYFVWAGEGILKSRLQIAIEQLGVTKQVKLIGERSDIPDLLDAADIFILPSEFEAMPLSVIEAMAKGLSVIVSQVGGVPEVLGTTGKLLPDPKINPQATVKDLITTIQTWAENPQLRFLIGQNCKQRAEAMFTEERMVQETLAIIEKTLLPIENNLFSSYQTNLDKPKSSLVSAIILTYNQAEFLTEAVLSFIEQDYQNLEIIIVNNASQDNSSQIAQQLIAAYPYKNIRLIEKPNDGASGGLNAGIAVAKGEYIILMAADNKLASNSTITNLMKVALEKDIPCVVFGSYKTFGIEQEIIESASLYSVEKIKQSNMIPSTSLYAKKVWEIVGGYKVGVFYEDWEFWLNCHKHNIPFYGIQEIVYYHRRHRSPSLESKRANNHQVFLSQVIYCHPEFYTPEVIDKAKMILAAQKLAPVDLIRSLGIPNNEQLLKIIEEYRHKPYDKEVLNNLRQVRKRIADFWLSTETNLENVYLSDIGDSYRTLLNNDIKYLP